MSRLKVWNGTSWEYADTNPNIITTSISSTSTDLQAPSAKSVYNELTTKQNISDKVTSINSSSTDTQYPSAKCVYDVINKTMVDYAATSREVVTGTWVTISQTTSLSAGIYIFSACVKFAAGQNGNRQLQFTTNSTGGTPYILVPTYSSTSTSTILTFTKIIEVNGGDIIYLRVKHTNGSTLTVSSEQFRYVKLS